jgi:hypothetical protein
LIIFTISFDKYEYRHDYNDHIDHFVLICVNVSKPKGIGYGWYKMNVFISGGH